MNINKKDLNSLQKKYLELIQYLHENNSGYSVNFNHCFARVANDFIYGELWYRKIKKPFYKNATDEELRVAIWFLKTSKENKEFFNYHNKLSKGYRKKE